MSLSFSPRPPPPLHVILPITFVTFPSSSSAPPRQHGGRSAYKLLFLLFLSHESRDPPCPLAGAEAALSSGHKREFPKSRSLERRSPRLEMRWVTSGRITLGLISASRVRIKPRSRSLSQDDNKPRLRRCALADGHSKSIRISENRDSSSRCDRPRPLRPAQFTLARSASGVPRVTLSSDFGTVQLRQLSLAIFRGAELERSQGEKRARD